ncbi:MAG: hypothetical protein IJU79_01975 [Desulfovibrionaceae bacterium]|nr:hypothetical protein [Desulfovibrionaceae bacterium]
MTKLFLPFILGPCLLLTACGGMSIIDPQGYDTMTQHLSQELAEHNLPNTKEAYSSNISSSNVPYGKILFNQLSPSFMQGAMAQYYLGDTFAQTMQPRRSSVSYTDHGFHIEHVSQSITVTMLAIVDWNQDGHNEWLISCAVTPKQGGPKKTWYLLTPPPLNAEEILLGTPCAILDWQGPSPKIDLPPSTSIPRTKQNNLPLTQVEEFKPGEHTVTTPPTDPQITDPKLNERSL